jgi:hypothetical protein
MVVIKKCPEQMPQMGLAANDEVVETLLPNSLHPPFGGSVEVGRHRSKLLDFDAFRFQDRVKFRYELGVMIAQEYSWR